VFLAGFIWSVRSGQYEDTCTPSMRVLMDDERGANSTDDAGPTQKSGGKDLSN
jgi:nitrogen fixation-related uncharacterized protein